MTNLTRMFRTFLDFLLPRSRDSELVRHATDASLASLIHIGTRRDIVSLFPYRHELVRALIWQLKYRNDERAAELLGGALASYLMTYVADTSLIIPIPLAPKRLRERGYNQVTLVLRAAITRGARGELREDILVRQDGHERQTRLSREARVYNVSGIFSVSTPHHVAGRDVVLVDDVTTTGSTLLEARKALLDAGAAHVLCVALAH